MKYFLFVFLLFKTISTTAQIKIVVAAPELLMPNKPLYMATNLNNWNPGDERFMLKKQSEGLYFIELPDTLNQFEYKFTQGNWNTVEADEKHGLLTNRVYIKKQEVNPKLINAIIVGWEKRRGYAFHLIKTPANTPHDAEIYIAGNFNNWLESDPQFKMERQFDGSFKIKVYTELDQIEYKFNRGNWGAVESWKTGKARPNRELKFEDIDSNKDVSIEIDNWEDLTATFNYFSIIDLLMLFAAFQGLLLSIAIPTMQDFNRGANRWLVILIGFASLMLFIRVVGNFRDVANALPKLLLIPHFILFTYAPLIYLYIQRLLFQKEIIFKNTWRHFLPFIIQLIFFLPYFFLDGKTFQHKVVNEERDLNLLFYASGLIALVINTYYLILCRRSIRQYETNYINETSYHQNINYLSTAILIHGICIILGFVTAVLFLIKYFWNANIAEVIENSISTIWFVFSMIGYILGYYAIHQPEIFKLTNEEPEHIFEIIENQAIPEENQVENQAILAKPKSTNIDDIEKYKEQLVKHIENDKPYINPNLALNDLATHLKIPSHLLSKVINDGFEKNFFDYINYYRIEEFKVRVNDPKFRNYTLLGIAFDVGFNSKTAFNRSFKKITNQTPSEYYLSRKI